MPFWSEMLFTDSNSPIMEQLIFFHDHSMIILTMITLMILYMMINISMNKFSSNMILEGQEIETIWTILPAIMLMFIAIPSIRILYLMEESFNPEITIKVMGHQWYWSYEYSNFNITFDSFMISNSEMLMSSFRLLDVDNNMIIPMMNNIRMLISSSDVIHSWTIPSMGVKMDAIPGRMNQIMLLPLRPGLFYGQCSEICGANHSFMPICMESTSTKNFLNWIKSLN
uniref:cytochrome c oxidase subunit II n=1 Tax=Uroobovella oviformis TaxID=3106009 RepID=UPI002E76CC65|nr:cytochrome c oxidase subunit II [Uroobovella oviformis]WPV72071.1 cytochrome c oxidase subunit II [Uroobovella oviformis]